MNLALIQEDLLIPHSISYTDLTEPFDFSAPPSQPVPSAAGTDGPRLVGCGAGPAVPDLMSPRGPGAIRGRCKS